MVSGNVFDYRNTASQQEYFFPVFVRAHCDNNMFSDWSLTTIPSVKVTDLQQTFLTEELNCFSVGLAMNFPFKVAILHVMLCSHQEKHCTRSVIPVKIRGERLERGNMVHYSSHKSCLRPKVHRQDIIGKKAAPSFGSGRWVKQGEQQPSTDLVQLTMTTHWERPCFHLGWRAKAERPEASRKNVLNPWRENLWVK